MSQAIVPELIHNPQHLPALLLKGLTYVPRVIITDKLKSASHQCRPRDQS